MKNLASSEWRELIEVIVSQKEINLEIHESVTKFKKQIPNENFSSPKEIPPSPAILNHDQIFNAFIHAEDNIDGRYIRLILMVYGLGGRILYTRLESGNYRAQIKWDKVQ